MYRADISVEQPIRVIGNPEPGANKSNLIGKFFISVLAKPGLIYNIRCKRGSGLWFKMIERLKHLENQQHKNLLRPNTPTPEFCNQKYNLN